MISIICNNKTMHIDEAIQECLDDLSLASNTERTYRAGLRVFLKFLIGNHLQPDDSVDDLNIDHFIQFLPWLDKKYSKQTTCIYGSASKSFMNYLVITGHLSFSYLDTIRYQKALLRSHRRHEDRLPRFPQKDDVERMISSAHGQPETSPRRERNIALIELLASSGCRISEAIALDILDIDLNSCSAIVKGKGNKERRIFFSQATAQALSAYWSARKSDLPSDPAFARHDRGAIHQRILRMTTTTARNIIKILAELAGIDPSKFSPHYFRHAFAIRVLSQTGNLALAQDLLGHADPKSTRVYAKIRADDLQKAHKEIFG
jgi:integrase/recombinase XerD